MKIGIISDTHNLLRPQALEALAGCEVILHGGDISRREVLDALEAVAPVKAVRGNNDGDWAADLPLTLSFELAGLRVCMAHKRKDLPADLSGYDLAVCGHTHRYEERREGRTLLLNPGSCGPRRFHQPITLALLSVEGGRIDVSRVDIPHGAREASGALPADLKTRVEVVMRETAKGRGPEEIARRHGWDPALVTQIARLYVTHPGVTADGILSKMGV